MQNTKLDLNSNSNTQFSSPKCTLLNYNQKTFLLPMQQNNDFWCIVEHLQNLCNLQNTKLHLNCNQTQTLSSLKGTLLNYNQKTFLLRILSIFFKKVAQNSNQTHTLSSPKGTLLNHNQRTFLVPMQQDHEFWFIVEYLQNLWNLQNTKLHLNCNFNTQFSSPKCTLLNYN